MVRLACRAADSMRSFAAPKNPGPYDMPRENFHWDDPLLLDSQLTDEEKMVRDAARTYAQKQLAPRVLEAFRREHTDPKVFEEMGGVGLLGATIPEAYG